MVVAVLLVAGAARPAEPASDPAATASKDAPSRSTHTVTRGVAASKIQVDAVFEAVEMVPVKVSPELWSDLVVLEAVPHGTRVKKGAKLVKLDTDKLKEQIDDLEQDRITAALNLELATAELENLEETTPLKLEASRRSRRIAGEDLTYFEKTGRAQKEKAAEFNLKSAEQRLEGAREELKQLEQMYKADELVEETEEIILKRQKFAVESAEYGLESAKLGAEQSLRTSIPREHESLKTQRRDQELALALAEETLPRALSKKRLEVERLKRDQTKAAKKLAALKKDFASLENVRAPVDGLVYYGACESGKWTTGAAVAKKLVPGGKLTPNEIFITVVNPDKLALKAVVQEADLARIAPGLEGKASPVSAPDRTLAVKVETISPVPLPAGGFELALVVMNDAEARFMPGMNCKVSFGESAEQAALRVPAEAVSGEGDERYVFVLKSDGKPEKRAVKTGMTDGKLIEIREGLSEGARILLSQPE